ncbi:MAG: hypothetical protein Fur0012_09510 [Elusimicrobiota bacterium]
MLEIKQIKKANRDISRAIISLYIEKGWWSREEKASTLNKIIKGSSVFAIALIDGELAGMGRIISDTASDAYIQDLAVFKKFEGRGTGSAILDFLIKKAAGFSFLGLIAQNGSEKFYSKKGFRLASRSKAMVYAKIRKTKRYGL